MMNFESIYRDYRDRIFRFTLNYTKDILEQEELVQDIFYQIFTSLPGFKRLSSLNTFIYSIARNTCLGFINQKIRERKKLDKLIKYYDSSDERSLFETFVMTEELKLFFHFIDQLDAEFREVFILIEVEELKYKDVARILNLPEGTVKSRLNRAKQKIAALLMAHKEAL